MSYMILYINIWIICLYIYILLKIDNSYDFETNIWHAYDLTYIMLNVYNREVNEWMDIYISIVENYALFLFMYKRLFIYVQKAHM